MSRTTRRHRGSARLSWLSSIGCVLLLLCVAVSPAVAGAANSVSEGIAPGEQQLGDSLVLPSVDRLVGGEQAQLARAARRSDPGAIAQRATSHFAFQGLSSRMAAHEAKRAFPALVDHTAGGVPQLPAGERIVGYPTSNAAQVALPGGVGVIETLEPIASGGSHGAHLPFDLTLARAGDGYAPVRSPVELSVPSALSRGVELPQVGVSLVPVDRRGIALAASAGQPDGAGVLWNAAPGAPAHDLATLAKASPRGFDLSTLLFSQRSPSQLYFRFGMPAGARLERQPNGAVWVVKGRERIAVVSPVSAEDAEGSSVPTSVSVSGRVISIHVDTSGDYLYPIAVDPEVNDAQLATTTGGKRSNWEFFTSNAGRFGKSAVYEGPGAERLETSGIAEYAPTEWAFWGYQTKGVSHIYEIKTETSGHNKGAKIESFLEFLEPGGARETKKMLSNEFESPEYEKRAATLCAANASKVEECLPGSGKAKNAIHFQQSATASPGGNYHFSDTMSQGIVSISEPTGTHSTTGYNTTSPTLEFEVENEGKKEKVKRTNALYGSGAWLSKFSGALQMIGSDPGIGVAATKLEYESSASKWTQLAEHNYLGVENACQGVQCYETHAEYSTLPTGLPDGEQKLRYKAEEAIAGTQSLEAEGQATVKVDGTPPHRLEVEGVPFGNELSERPYELTGKATDGEGSTLASSGIKSVALYVDGHAFGSPAGSCTVAKGECTASGKWTVNGAELGAGKHDIEIVALDNAGNEAQVYEPITIRHSTPVPLGPGSVDLQSGDFAFKAGDVSLGSGLTVARNYSSRALHAGETGPLGPQWSLSLGNAESLNELVDGSVLMSFANGGQAIFASLGGGKFESPTGDSNLELTLEENKTTKEKLAYYLKNPAAHTSVKFTRPAGATIWVPTKQEGASATDTVTYAYQTGKFVEYPVAGSNIVPDADGNMWIIKSAVTSEIGQLTALGQYTHYAIPTGAESFTVTPEGTLYFAKGTSAAYTITAKGEVKSAPACSPECYRVTTGADGKVWGVAPESKIETFAVCAGCAEERHVYSLPTGSEPTDITAGPENTLWFSERGTSKIGKITTAGTVTEYALPAGSNPTRVRAGAEGNIWYLAGGTKKIGKITTAGTITEYPLPSGASPNALNSGPDGNMWYADSTGNTVAKVTPSGVITQYPLPSGTSPAGIAAGPDGNMWFIGATTGVVPVTGPALEPTEELAPVPAGVSCAPEFKPGCRALKFKYAMSTTATGEGSSEWGDFQTRLTEVLLKAYDPSSKTMKETAVAKYAYDKLGRLRAEWDPRITPNLKKTYGYDPEGHVTVLAEPGQEPWLFTYGTVAADAGSGRLIKARRIPPSTELWNGTPVLSTIAPVIVGGATEGVKLAASPGSWSVAPSAYAFQWKQCNSSGFMCKIIPGAVKQAYTLSAADVGHTIVVSVTATNGGGSATATSAATEVVGSLTGRFREYALPEGSGPDGISGGPSGEERWFTDFSTNKVGRILNTGAVTEFALPAGSQPKGIAASGGAQWFTEYGTNKIGKITTAGAITEYALPAGSHPFDIAEGPDENLWFTEQGTNKIGKVTKAGTITEYALPAGSTPEGITRGQGILWFTEYGSNKIGKITTAGAITEYGPLPLLSRPSAITSFAGNVWFTDRLTSKVGKITEAGVVTEYSLRSGSELEDLVAGSDGNLWVAAHGGGKVARVTSSGVATEFTLPAGAQGTEGIASSGEELWFTQRNDKIGRMDPRKLKDGEVAGAELPTEPGITLNYNVPVTGAGAPHNMSASEVAKWGQVDIPVEATAISPEDEPQGWPATSYKRAAIYYLDAQGRQVNVASPSSATYGSIATTEYNEFNDVIRTLTPDNRATALAAGASSAEVSKLLDTQNTYNGEGKKEGEVSEPGTRLIDTLGPQHKIAYVAGKEHKESLARLHEEFVYDQGAPSGETYDLVTEKFDLAQLVNHEEVEVRTTKTSYSGQSNLGWKLRAPTSVTVDPEGLNLTTTTEYDPTTGQVKDVREPAGGSTFNWAVGSQFGEAGTAPGKLKNPWGVVVNSEGKLLVVDSANNRVEEFGADGTYILTFGEAGSGNGQLKEPTGIALDSAGHIWIADTGNNRVQEFSSAGTYMATVGSLGTESGKFKAPSALAFDAKGNLWVADTGNSRVEKFDKEAKYASEFGSLGTEPGKLAEPKGVVVDSGEHVWVADTGNNRIQEFSTNGSLLRRIGTAGAGEGQLNAPIDMKIGSTGNLWTVDANNNRAESFSPSGGYVTQIGWKGTEVGQLTGPRSLAVDASGKVWVSDSSNNRLQQWAKDEAHGQYTIYYGAAFNPQHPSCGEHPEWAGLICETSTTKQPELMSLPKLPLTSFTYNMYDEPEVVTENFGSATRTTTTTYDAAGRRASSQTTATSGTALPKVIFEYNKELGKLEKQTTEGEGKVIASEFNRFGQVTKYTDADGNVAKFKYFGVENDYQLEEASDSSSEGSTHQTYAYDETTKLRTKLTDSAAGSFSASYDAEGKLTSVAYPYLCANYARNAAGETTSVQYLKTTNCGEAEAGEWYSDSSVPSIRGEMLSQTSTLASDSYTYDSAGRLLETQETPTGEGCTVRAYAYDEEGNRASLATRSPGTGGACQTEGGTVEGHNYDEGNRLADGGMAYDAFGNVTTLPAADAEGHELTSSFYVDNAVASQTQNGVTNSYLLDPEGRVRETVTGSKHVVSHYDAPGDAVAWTSEPGNWTRNIAGIDGALLATQTNGATPVLQLRDLQGDVVATLGDKAGETKLLSTYNSTEFGVPNAGKPPPKFAYLGAMGVESSLASGVITFGATSYVPQIGRTLQSEQVAPPGLPGGSGAGAAYTAQEEPWNMLGAARAGAEAPGLEAGREMAAMEAAFAAAQDVDPEVLLTLGNAREMGEKFKKIATATEILDVIGSIPDVILGKIAGLIWDKFTVENALDWYHDAGQKLIDCSNLYGQGFRRCLFKYTDFTINLEAFGIHIASVTLVQLGIAPEVEKCLPALFSVPGQPYVWRCERLGQNYLEPPR